MRPNSQRFIIAYNKIDACLRSIYNYKANISFTDLIRRCADKNYIVRSNETMLVDYARLRNAIVHKSTEDYIIAEPHDSVVENMERIAKSICTPPLAASLFKEQKLLTIESSENLKSAIRLIAESKYSNIPVYENNTLKGIVNNKLIVERIGRSVALGKSVDSYIENTSVGSILDEKYFDTYYTVCPNDITMEEVVNLFSSNRRLIAVLMTKKGTRLEYPSFIITVYDMLGIAEVLDNYE